LKIAEYRLIMTIEEWKKQIEKHGTSGDMVDLILNDWIKEVEMLRAEIRELTGYY
jgi:hypothetical protein